jgi:hypothetical protein
MLYMKPQRRQTEAEAADAEPAAARPEMPQAMYRVAGDLEVRSAELRHEIEEQKATIQRLEREVWTARKLVRNRRRLAAMATGGLGALIGALFGAAAYFAFGPPLLVLGMSFLGFLVGLYWAQPEEDNFPDAPPPRFR